MALVVSATSKLNSGFDPRTIPNCALWLDAADQTTLTFTGSQVTSWIDKSGNGNTASNFSQQAATYSSNGLVFSGSNGYTTAIQSTTSPQTRFIVAQHSSANLMNVIGVQQIGSSGVHGAQSIISNNIQRTMAWGGTTIATGATITQGTRFLYGATIVSGGAAGTNPILLDGTQRGSNTGTASTLNGNGRITIGAARTSGGASANGTEFFIGTINEVLIFTRTLVASERQQVEGYLARKWGIVSNLPTTHPYRSLPVLTRPFQPTDLPDCRLWLDAADRRTVTLSGSNVTAVADKSGQNVTLSNATGFTYVSNFNGTYPAFYHPTKNIGGVTLGYNSAFSVATPAAVFFVMKQNTWAPGDTAYLLDASPSSSGTGRPYVIGGLLTPGIGGAGVYDTSIPSVLFIQWGPSVSGFANGTVQSSGGSTSFTTGGINVGSFWGVNGGSWDGFICEVLVYSGTLTTVQRQQVEGYLADKWGLRTPLPSTHPFKLLRAVTPPFTPLQVSGCALWLDATDPNGNGTLLANGANVSTWVDKSGSNNNATTFNNLFPTFFTTSSFTKAPYLRFNATNWANNNVSNVNVMSLPNFQNTANVSVFYVCLANPTYYPANSMRPFFILKGIFSNQQVFLETNPHLVGPRFANPSFSSSISITAVGNEVVMTSAVFNDATKVFNGGQNGSNTSFSVGTSGWLSTMASNGTISIGAYFDTFGKAFQNGGFNGELYEVLVFNAALTASQRQQVEGYLATKWGLRNRLPASHPFKVLTP